MTGRKAIVGLCMLCALLVSAFAAQSASAVTKGTTAFTCVKNGTGPLHGEHCLKEGPPVATEYGHVEIAQDTTTEVEVTNAKTFNETKEASTQIFKAVIAGTTLELRAPEVHGSGWVENKKAASGEHYLEGTVHLEYTGVEVAKPAGKGCKAFTDNAGVEASEEVIDATLKVSSQGQGDNLNFTPDPEGEPFSTFFITCTGSVPAELQGTWSVTGSLKCPTNGATITCFHNEGTTQNTLKTKGVKAGLEGAVTVLGRVKNSGAAYTPLSVTTVETP